MDGVKLDCLHFRGDRPCAPHKREGVKCDDCAHYVPVRTRVLMIKLDAMGDVLRTTCLLPGISARYDQPQITWITGKASVPLLQKNPFVQRVLPTGDEALALLAAEQFDVVLNLDASPRSATLATLARGAQKIGYVMNPRGHVEPTGPSAEHWFRMGLFDDLKKANRRSYQDLMCEIAGLDPASCRYVLELTESERAWARGWAAEAGLSAGAALGGERPLVGLNTGAGGRWQYKRWREEGYRELIHRLTAELSAQVILLGGEEEQEENRRLASSGFPRDIVVSGSHPVRRFTALVELCDAVVTGDTLAMHLSLAMRRPTVTFFGPTSPDEIELFGLGEKLVPEMDCLVCYKETCDFKPACMDLITTDQMYAAVRRALGR